MKEFSEFRKKRYLNCANRWNKSTRKEKREYENKAKNSKEHGFDVYIRECLEQTDYGSKEKLDQIKQWIESNLQENAIKHAREWTWFNLKQEDRNKWILKAKGIPVKGMKLFLENCKKEKEKCMKEELEG